jgi:hypothetical protein
VWPTAATLFEALPKLRYVRLPAGVKIYMETYAAYLGESWADLPLCVVVVGDHHTCDRGGHLLLFERTPPHLERGPMKLRLHGPDMLTNLKA